MKGDICWKRTKRSFRRRFALRNSLKVDPRQLTVIGRGGHHLVLVDTKHPRIVIKVAYDIMRAIIEKNLATGNASNRFPERLWHAIKPIIRKDHRRLNEVRRFFGCQHVLHQRRTICSIPLFPALITELGDIDGRSLAKDAWSVITIQPYAAVVSKAQHHFATGYAELQPGFSASAIGYQNLNNMLLMNDLPPTAAIDIDYLLEVQGATKLRALWQAARSDPVLHQLLCNLVRSLIDYTRSTGEILDVAASGNLLIYKEAATWRYLLCDTLVGFKTKLYHRAMAIAKQSAIHWSGREYGTIILNVVNYVRTVNGLAAALGLKDHLRFKLPPEMMERLVNEWRQYG